MAIYFSKDFDTVSHTQLLLQILASSLSPNIIRWLSCYLKDRTARCSFNGTLSAFRPVHASVPQGSVISPALFNHFVSNYPHTAPLITSYADDFTAAASAMDVPAPAATLSAHSSDDASWAHRKGLTVSIPKSHSSLTILTSHEQTHMSSGRDPTSHCVGPQKSWGATFNPHYTFSPHIGTVCERARSRLNILKSLAGTSWGQQKETTLITFKSLIKSLFTYASPIWFPNSSPSSIAKLQIVQNAALRTTTGSHKMAFVSHLHSEMEVLPVADSLSLLCSQYLASFLRPHHPSHHVVRSPQDRAQ